MLASKARRACACIRQPNKSTWVKRPSASSASSNPPACCRAHAGDRIDRANAISGGSLDLEDLKIIVLMVFWSLGEEPTR